MSKYKFFISPYQVKALPRPLNKILQFLCGIGGHSFDGDWGYGGGDYADVWCRHCDHFAQVPKTSIWFRDKEAKQMMETLNNPTPKQPT